jgi:hypothetical protein
MRLSETIGEILVVVVNIERGRGSGGGGDRRESRVVGRIS